MKNKPTVILGVNTSHDTAVAVVEDGIVKHVYEEERSRRSKYWSPSEDNNGDEPYEELGLVCIEHKQLHSPDYLAFASFDRRDFKVNVTDKVKHDRELQQALIKDISSQQLSYEHLVSIQSEYGSSVFQKNTRKEDEDEYINKSISQQEIECIWHYKNEEVTPLYKRYSNHRFLSDLRNEMNMGGWGEDPLMCMNDETYDYDGVESVFTSLPSMGMNFSNMSYALGCDEHGRAAGKVMGMATYGTLQPDGSMGNIWNKHTTANKLEHDSLDHAQTVIQKALDLVPNCKNIVLSGGFSLNCTNNAKYLKLFPDVQFFVDPIPHDGGTAVGAALDMHRSILKGEENATDTNS